MSDHAPNPGSPEAVTLGCQCPVLDNSHGQGNGMKNEDGTPVFWISSHCPIRADTVDWGKADG